MSFSGNLWTSLSATIGELLTGFWTLLLNPGDDVAIQTLVFSIQTLVLTLVVRVGWFLGNLLIEWIILRASQRVTKHQFEFGNYSDYPTSNLTIQHLLVRFGKDEYLRDLASDRERITGRLQLKTRKASIVKNADGSARIKTTIPIHKRLGTQFKFFVDVHDPARTEEVCEYIRGLPNVVEASISDSALKNRIYLLLDTFDTAQTVDGPVNNFLYPL